MPTDPGGHDDQTRGTGGSASRRWIPFPVLQAGELGIAVSFAVLSVHVHNPLLLLVAAALVTLLALTADGPLGVLRICGQPLHVHLVAAAAVLIAFAPVVPALRSDIEGILVTTFGAVGLLRLATLTRVQGPLGAGRRRSRRASGPVIDATATVSAPEAAAPEQPAAPPAESVLHRTGRAAGVASAAGRRVVERNRPEVEVQVRRGLRKAGRTVGRWTSGTSGGPADRSP